MSLLKVREIKRGEEKGRITMQFPLRSRNYEIGITK
jgi:hypothetical protein